MTTRTAAERAQEFEDWWRGLQENDPPESMKEAAAIAWCWMRQQRDTFRAALAQPQEGEVERIARDLEEIAQDWSNDHGGDTSSNGYAVPMRAARLLRATQSNGHSPVGDESPRQNAKGAEGCHDAPNASGESPAQSAPAQEPVAWRYKERINCGQGQYIDSDWKLASFRPMLGGSSDGGCSSGVTHLEPLYVLAQAQPQEGGGVDDT